MPKKFGMIFLKIMQKIFLQKWEWSGTILLWVGDILSLLSPSAPQPTFFSSSVRLRAFYGNRASDPGLVETVGHHR